VFHHIVNFNRKARKGLRKVREVLLFEINLCNLCLSSSIPKKSASIRFIRVFCVPIFLSATETNG